MSDYNSEQWNRIVASFPKPHVLQTWQWAVAKSYFGWKPIPKVWGEGREIPAAALILKRSIRLPLLGDLGCILYVPKGPLVRDWSDRSLVDLVLEGLEALAVRERALLLKIDPDVRWGKDRGESERSEDLCGGETFPQRDNVGKESALGEQVVSLLRSRGWIFSNEQVQFRNTMTLNLDLPEDELLRKMKQKTRYNIRLAEKKGVVIREGTRKDLSLLYHMYQETSRRDGFTIRGEEYYMRVWQTFLESCSPSPVVGEGDGQFALACKTTPFASILIAEYEEKPIAGLILFVFGDRAWYMYGMSSNEHRDKMPNYLLHWRAIQRLRRLGVREYDLWGAPDRFDESDPMYGVYRFKSGFGAELVCHIGAWDFPVSRLKYRLYQEVLPKYLQILRIRGRIGA